MKFAIKAEDKSYLEVPLGDCSSNQDWTWELEDASLYDSLDSANYGLEDFSKKGKIVGVDTVEREFAVDRSTCDRCEGTGKDDITYGQKAYCCSTCNGKGFVEKLYWSDENETVDGGKVGASVGIFGQI